MKTLHFLFLLIFTFHFNVQASRLYLPISPEVISVLIEQFNAMTPSEKSKYVADVIRKSDPAFFRKHEKALERVQWPELHYDKNEVIFTQDGKTIALKLNDQNLVIVNGKAVELKKNKFDTAHSDIAMIFETPKTSFLDFFINSAHAILPLLIALVAIAAAALILYPLVNVMKAAFFKVKCYEIRSELGDVESETLTMDQASDLKSRLRRLQADNEKDLKAATDPATQRDLESSKYCYGKVISQLDDLYPDQVNDSERGESFLDRWMPSFLKSSPSSGTHKE